MRNIKTLVCCAAAGAAISFSACQAFAAQWYDAVNETYTDGGVLDYTVYNYWDTSSVSIKTSCPNDDASQWDVTGVEYMGENYMGSPWGGIKANITKYVANGDKLSVRFRYRSDGYSITPKIEVLHTNGTKDEYVLPAAQPSGIWTDYEAQTEEIAVGKNDSVIIAFMNERGFWHMNGLEIDRYGDELKGGFFSNMQITGIGDNYELWDGRIVVNADARENADVFGAIYSGGVLKNIVKAETGDSIRLEIRNSGGDTMKILAWDSEQKPLSEELTIKADGSGTYRKEAETLKEQYADSFLFGTVYNPGAQLDRDKDTMLTQFNVITPENIMKPEYIAPSEGQYNWYLSDEMVNFAEANGLEVIGHTLVWHNQTPSWFTEGTAEEVENNLKTYIQTVVGRYKGRIKGWDVVNEAIRDNFSDVYPTSWSYYLRKESETSGSPWYRALRDADYIYRSFLYAHEADPDAELYYNDYNLDNPIKRECAALLVEHINNKYKQEYNTDENLVDAIGMQSHFSLTTNTDDVRASIERFRQAGVRVNITELDVTLVSVADNSQGADEGTMEFTEPLEERQAAKYAELMTIYKENADIIDRVTIWGVTDDTSWRSSLYPVLFNSDYTPKKAFNAVMDPVNYR